MNDLFEQETELQREKRRVFAEAQEEGCHCPLCGQFVKVYKRKITSTMARQLLQFYKLTLRGKQWIHTREAVFDGSSGAGDFAKLSYWGLIEARPHEPGNEGKKTSGYWRITERGVQFCLGQMKVPLHAYVYNHKVLEFSPESTDITEALTEKFDYRELMDSD